MTERNTLVVAVITAITWGLTGIFVRLLPGVSPLAITAVRLLVALVSVLPTLIFLDKSRGVAIDFSSTLRQPVAYALASLLVGYYLLATIAFQRAPVAEVALLISTQPLFVLGFRSVYGDRPAWPEIVGALLALGGMIIILAPAMTFGGSSAIDHAASVRHIYGSVMAIGAAALSAIYAYAYRLLSERHRVPESSVVSVLTFAIGSAVLLVLLALSPVPSGLTQPGAGRIALLLGLGIVSTAVPTLGFSIASRRLPAVVTATISLLVPLFGGVFGYLVLDERLSATFLVGCLPVIGGVAMIVRRNGVR